MVLALRSLALASLLLLTGCLRSTTTVIVDDDGGGTATVVLALDPDQAADIASAAGGVAGVLSDQDSDRLCDRFRELSLPSNLPPEATVTPYDQDGFCGHLIEFAFSDGQELATALDQTTGGQATDLDAFVLESDGEGWTFEAPLVGLFAALDGAVAGFGDELVTTALANTQISYDLTMPGTADTDDPGNADRIDGGTFRWVIDATDPPDALIARTTLDGGGGGALPLILVAVGVLAALAVGAVILMRRSGATAPDTGLDPAASPAPGVVMGSPDPGPAAPTAVNPVPPPDPPGSDAPATTLAPPPPAAEAGPPDGATPGPAGARGAMGATAEQPLHGAEPAEEAAVAGPEPRWDEARQAWVADHPSGLLVHDAATGEWRPA